MRTLRTRPIAFLLMSAAWLAACSSAPPKPVVLKLTFAASPDVNPDSQNRASPVVVRLYQLKDDAAFKEADVFALFDKEQATLAAALVSREEYQLAPGERRTINMEMAKDTRFLGVVAAYRDIRNAHWRAEVGSPDKGMSEVAKKDKINIAVERDRVSFAHE